MSDNKIAPGNSHDANLVVEESKIEDVNANENANENADEKVAPPPMRSKSDDLSVWEAVKRYKFVTLVGMAGAFSASLDGYRKIASK